ncbi:hypothetical protein FGIG_10991 [Fasciola gigantica]|uniref:Secreted protein n=1 Tax=Fasciola gigantica TaxID=46835 RepID=A0A504YIY0_FASGI|nr:hypothetical protein FGIG_10991 [Fasciola gigantica]
MFAHILISVSLTIVLIRGSPITNTNQQIRSVVYKCVKRFPNCQFNQSAGVTDTQRVDKRYMRMLRLG